MSISSGGRSADAQVLNVYSAMNIQAIAPHQASNLMVHHRAAAGEAGADGRPRFHPDPTSVDDPGLGNLIAQQIGRGLDEPGWRRVWGVFDEDGEEIVAQVELRGSHLRSQSHRSMLGMSVLANHQRRRLGARLLDHAILWARTTSIEWIDLGVFEENFPAIALYKRFGFVETGRLVDVFRFLDTSVNDIRMTLQVRTFV